MPAHARRSHGRCAWARCDALVVQYKAACASPGQHGATRRIFNTFQTSTQVGARDFFERQAQAPVTIGPLPFDNLAAMSIGFDSSSYQAETVFSMFTTTDFLGD